MNPDLYPIIGSVVGALILGAFGLAGGIWAYRKNKADATKSLVDSALGLVKEYKQSLEDCNEHSAQIMKDAKQWQDQLKQAEDRATAAEAKVAEFEKTIDFLRTKIKESEADRAQLREHIGALETQIESLGFTPRSKMSRTRKSDHTKKE